MTTTHKNLPPVLGGSDAENCTFQLGYVGRQALYSCKTCSDKSGIKAGICLACSLKCHDGHELFELYTKRNFRCDCGLKDKFPDTRCELDPVSDESLLPLHLISSNLHLSPNRLRVDPTIRIRTIRTSTESIVPVIARILMQRMKMTM